MKDSDSAALTIGAVTRLTGISSHTLRKWESRYGAVEPLRSDTGRRLYTPAQVQRLIHLRDLTRQGHQISQLSRMTDEELTERLGQAPDDDAGSSPRQAVVVGQVLAALLRQKRGRRDVTLVAESAAEWLKSAEVPDAGDDRALVLELPTVSERSLARLLELRQHGFMRVIVVYGFATKKSLRRLLDGGVLCLKAPTSAEEILRNLRRPDGHSSVLETLERQAVPAHRFSEESIALLAGLSPKLACECPNHIAQLLLDISAFEQYSLECEDSDPEERALHARLRLIAANARALFEQAMADVARREGLELEELDGGA